MIKIYTRHYIRTFIKLNIFIHKILTCLQTHLSKITTMVSQEDVNFY